MSCVRISPQVQVPADDVRWGYGYVSALALMGLSKVT